MALKQLVFSKNRSACGGFAPCPPKPPATGSSVPRPPSVICLSYSTSLNTSPNSGVLTLVNQTTASGLLFCDISVPQKVPLSKMYDDVIACDLWLGTLPIKNPGYEHAYCSLRKSVIYIKEICRRRRSSFAKLPKRQQSDFLWSSSRTATDHGRAFTLSLLLLNVKQEIFSGFDLTWPGIEPKPNVSRAYDLVTRPLQIG